MLATTAQECFLEAFVPPNGAAARPKAPQSPGSTRAARNARCDLGSVGRTRSCALSLRRRHVCVPDRGSVVTSMSKPPAQDRLTDRPCTCYQAEARSPRAARAAATPNPHRVPARCAGANGPAGSTFNRNAKAWGTVLAQMVIVVAVLDRHPTVPSPSPLPSSQGCGELE